jgi:predicted phosphodiesterase
MSLRLLHISDIHFRRRVWDADADVHRELVADVRALVDAEGPIDAVLVGGDIAFGGEPEEYAMASEWLKKIRAAAGSLDESRVWTVPGNHDINRTILRESVLALQFREDLAAVAPNDLDFALQKRVNDPSADGLIKPLEPYNDFARPFNCAVKLKQPHWLDRSLRAGGLEVQLTGLNSVLTSGPGHDAEGLVLGTYQCQLPRDAGTIRIAMVHHPPGWIRDWDVVSPFLHRAHILLFGHEHAFAARQLSVGGTLEVAAGAVTPERQEHGPEDPYVPSFNVITIDVAENVEVTVHPRKWDHEHSRFSLHPDGLQTFQVGLDPQSPEPELPNPVAAAQPAEASPLVAERGNVEDGTISADLRLLAVQFMNLPATQKLQIARDLQLIEEDDLAVPFDDLFLEVLARVRHRGLVNELREAVRGNGIV